MWQIRPDKFRRLRAITHRADMFQKELLLPCNYGRRLLMEHQPLNQAVDTLINRYIIEFGPLESWSKPNSRYTPFQVFVNCANTIKNPSNIHFMDEKVISQWCHDPIINSLFLHDWVPFYMPPKQSELDVMCECLLVLCFTKERNVDPSTSETSVLTVWHFIFSNWCCNWTVGLV